MIEDKLKKMGDKNSHAREFFLWLKASDSSYKILGASKTEEITGIDYYDIIALFKKFDNYGAGDFIVGRKGHDSRMVWNYDTKSIGYAGLGELDLFEDLEDISSDAIIVLDEPNKNKVEDSLKHTFRLRQDFELEVSLPVDFNMGDVNRLKSWLELLVY